MTRQQVLVVAFDGVRLGSLGLVTDAMAMSDRYRGLVYGGHTHYPSNDEVTGLQVRVLTTTGGPVHALAGPRLAADGRVGGDAIARAVFLPAFELTERPAGWQAVCSWLARQHAGGALVAAAGASVLALADAGLLDGRHAVAEHRTTHRIETAHPAVVLLPGLPVLASRDLITAATADGEVEMVRELVRRINSPNSLAWLDQELGREADSGDALTSRFLQLARERYAEPHLIAAIAAELGTTERTLRRRCQVVLGASPGEVLRTLRLDAAKIMLRRTSIPVERVGNLVGYTDPAAFRAQFRRQFGHPPSAARTQPSSVTQRTSRRIG
jgi:transcriptional regulator GlxA family with amidase domain